MLWVKATASKSTNPIELKFTHKLSKIIVGLQHENGETDVTSAIVSICGTKPSATFNLSTGEITNPSGSATDIKAAQSASAAAIIIPQTVNEGTKFIKVEFNGKTFYYTLSENKTFESGKAYDFSLTLREKGPELSLTSPSSEGNIIDWNGENTIQGDANEEETLAENMIVINNQPLSRALKVALGEENVTINNEGYAVLDANYVSTVTNINMGEYTEGDLENLNGIENFVSLTHLYLPSSPSLTECDLSQNTALILLDTYSTTALTSLDLSNNTSIQQLYLNENTQLSSLILTSCTQLFNLQIDNTALTSIDIPNKNGITNLLYGGSTNINIDLNDFPNLVGLGCKNKNLDGLDFIPDGIKNQLQWLYCSNNNIITLDLSEFTSLQMLDCSNNKITSLTLPQSITQLECQNNQITQLDISNFSNLEEWHCGNQTDANSTPIEMELTLTPTQKENMENSDWGNYSNYNIIYNTTTQQ